MINEVQGSLNKRASKRYTYLPQARLDAQNIRQNIQIRDVSKSGLQFFSNSFIQSNAPVCVTWQDQSFGSLAPFLLIIRKLDQQSSGVFRYCYGSKFVNLRHDTRSNLEKLVTQTKTEENDANRKLIRGITIETLLSIIKQGRPFLHHLLQGNDASKHFVRFTREVRDYEKKSFDKSDEISQYIQKLTAHNFHINLLNIAIPLVPKNIAQGFELYQETVQKIELVSKVIIETKPFLVSIDAATLAPDAKINLKRMISESNTRLLYSKLELLQTFVETYESDTSASKGLTETVKKIIDEYNQTSPTLKATKSIPRPPRR
jgi:hypothetical protein